MKVNAMAYADMLRMLYDGQFSLQELSDETGLHKNTVHDYVKALARRKIVHIAGWAADSRGAWTIREYRFGDKPNVRRPRAKTGTQRTTEYLKRKKAAAEREAYRQMTHAIAGVLQSTRTEA